MNYFKIYTQLMRKSQYKKRVKGDGEYYESHHIKPQCLGGGREVLLTAREHFVQHLLLTKIYPKNRKLQYAFNMMFRISECQERYLPPSHYYEYRRKIFIKNHPSKQKEYKVNHISGMIEDFQTKGSHVTDLKECNNCSRLFQKRRQKCIFCGVNNNPIKKSLYSKIKSELEIDLSVEIPEELSEYHKLLQLKFKETQKECLVCGKFHINKICCSVECFQKYCKLPDNEYSKVLSAQRKKFIRGNKEAVHQQARKAAVNRDEDAKGKKISQTKRRNNSGNNGQSQSALIFYKNDIIMFHKPRNVTLTNFCIENNLQVEQNKIKHQYNKKRIIKSGLLKGYEVVKYTEEEYERIINSTVERNI